MKHHVGYSYMGYLCVFVGYLSIFNVVVVRSVADARVTQLTERKVGNEHEI